MTKRKCPVVKYNDHDCPYSASTSTTVHFRYNDQFLSCVHLQVNVSNLKECLNFLAVDTTISAILKKLVCAMWLGKLRFIVDCKTYGEIIACEHTNDFNISRNTIDTWHDPDFDLALYIPAVLCQLIWQYVIDIEHHHRRLEKMQMLTDNVVTLVIVPAITLVNFNPKFEMSRSTLSRFKNKTFIISPKYQFDVLRRNCLVHTANYATSRRLSSVPIFTESTLLFELGSPSQWPQKLQFLK